MTEAQSCCTRANESYSNDNPGRNDPVSTQRWVAPADGLESSEMNRLAGSFWLVS